MFLKKIIDCKIRFLFITVPVRQQALHVFPFNHSFPLSLHHRILTPLASHIILCLSHCHSLLLNHCTSGQERTPVLGK